MANNRVMVVEDEGIVALSIERKLQNLGYEVPVVVASGAEAIEQASHTQPNLVLMDIRLSGEMDGIEAADQIRTKLDIPVIFLTAYSDEATLQRAKVTDSFGYLLKPFEERALRGAIEMALYKHRTDRKLKEYSVRLKEMVEDRTQDLKQALENLEATQEQILRQDRLATFGKLAGGVAHELRNPLGVVSNAIFFLKMTLSGADETTVEYLDLIDNRIQEMSKIVTDLLSFARVQPVQRKETSLLELVDEMLRRHPPPENVVVNTAIPADVPSVFVDAQQIVQVLTILTMNAYQAMPDGGELTYSAQIVDAQIHLSVTDTGTGIPPETLSKIFEPLFSTKAQGVGLGLALAKNLLEGNEGKFAVESGEGQGRIPLP